MDRTGTCCLCGGGFDNFGCNPDPLGDVETERCCHTCDEIYVIPTRIGAFIDENYAPEQVIRRFVKLMRTVTKRASQKSKKR